MRSSDKFSSMLHYALTAHLNISASLYLTGSQMVGDRLASICNPVSVAASCCHRPESPSEAVFLLVIENALQDIIGVKLQESRDSLRVWVWVRKGRAEDPGLSSAAQSFR
jgi:hypothetical protein